MSAPICRALVLCLALVPTTSGAGARADESTFEVAVSVYPLELLVREIGGDRVRVTTLVPPGASPHTFEPRPSDVASLTRARLFLRVGAGYDDWAETLTAAAGSLTGIALLAHLDPDALLAAHPHDGRAAVADPHVWLDPLLVRNVLAPALARQLAAADPAGAASFRTRSDTFAARLTRLDAEIRSELEAAGARSYVAFHGAWRYFARRYGLVEVGVVREFAGDEATPLELMRLVEGARAAGVAAILVEPQLDPRVARTLAGEFGGITVVVDPLGDPRDPERSRYESLMRWNARAFARALMRPSRET